MSDLQDLQGYLVDFMSYDRDALAQYAADVNRGRDEALIRQRSVVCSLGPVMKRPALALASAGVILALSACGLTAPPPPEDSTVSAPAASATASATGSSDDAPGIKAADFTDAEEAALRIRNVGCGSVATGSGFAISDHVLVTNRHVVGGATTLQVSTYDGHDINVDASGATNVADLAVVLTDQSLPQTISWRRRTRQLAPR